MSDDNGFISRYITAIALLFLLIPSWETKGQKSILDSTFTFRAGIIKTVNALNLITRQTGYYFTYDSHLINPEKKAEVDFNNTHLRTILDGILKDNSLKYSVIDEFIIISREITPAPHSPEADSTVVPFVKFITGVIVDRETSEPLPYATIGLKNAGKGTVSNFNGEFGIKILPENYNDTITVSYLGYYGREIPIGQSLGNNFSIAMRREFISIPEIIIRNQIPQEIIYKTLAAIGRNYGSTPANLTAFYREGVLKKNQLQSYSEAILEIYKSAYTGSLLNDQIKVLKSRKIENIGINDSLAVRLKAGLSTCLELDGIKNRFDFLDRENIEDYSYRLTDIISLDEESAFEIEFTPREGTENGMFKGSVFINTSDFAVLQADFEINAAFLHKKKEDFITNPSKDFTTWPVSVKYSVSYRKVNNRYFLSHVRGDLLFSAKQKKRLFNTQFNVFFEMAVTQLNLRNAVRFEKEELAPIHSIFSKTITTYDPVFWGSQDFLKPEDNLLQAIKNMKVKLQEFSENQ